MKDHGKIPQHQSSRASQSHQKACQRRIRQAARKRGRVEGRRQRRRRRRLPDVSFTHTSAKLIGGACKCRSKLELSYVDVLDSSDEICSYAYETLIVKYISNKRSGKVRRYIPDFVVETMRYNKLVIVEVKPLSKIAFSANIKKSTAARNWARANNALYVIVTEKETGAWQKTHIRSV